MKIVVIAGARPNFIKVAPLMEEMGGSTDIDSVLVHTGQHYDKSMSSVFFSDLRIPDPDYNLGVGSGTHSWQTAQVMLALEPLFVKLQPDLILTVGDVNSTLAAALVGAKVGIRIAHIEAGLRSRDRTMPEEINRILTDSLSDFLFTTERDGSDNLRHEGVPNSKIHFVGNVMADSLLRHRHQADLLNMPTRYGLSEGEYALLTLHRPSNVDMPEMLKGFVDAVERLQRVLPLLFAVHPRTLKRLGEAGLVGRLNGMANLRLTEPLSYLEFLGLMSHARVVLTDSGGIQEETTILGVPCLTLRDNTERPVTINEGTNTLVGTVPDRIVSAARHILDGNTKRGRCPELWDGHAAVRIVKILREQLGSAQ